MNKYSYKKDDLGLTKNQKLVWGVIRDRRNWQAPGCGKIRQLTGIKHNKSIISAIRSLTTKGFIKIPNIF